jgi:hypothetical protein
MNGKMDYSDQDTSTVDLIRKQAINYNEPLLRNAIKAVGPEYLRFPGGTVASIRVDSEVYKSVQLIITE